VAALVPWLTPRQLEYWIERGWIIPADPAVQGHPRSFGAAELKVLKTMARLVRAGIPPRPAAQIARRAVTVACAADGTCPDGVSVQVALAGGGLVLVISDV